jgi:hypothetical protein
MDFDRIMALLNLQNSLLLALVLLSCAENYKINCEMSGKKKSVGYVCLYNNKNNVSKCNNCGSFDKMCFVILLVYISACTPNFEFVCTRSVMRSVC